MVIRQYLFGETEISLQVDGHLASIIAHTDMSLKFTIRVIILTG